MAKRIIRTGTTVDPTGDSLKNAFTKVNDNFTEIYNALGLDENTLNIGAFEFNGSTMSTTDSSSIVIDQAATVTSNLSVGGDILPQTANGGDLGSSTLPWRSLYVSNNTIYIGNTALGINQSGQLTVGGAGVLTSAVLNNGLDADLKGSVFADDSTVMIDSVAGKLVGEIDTNIGYITNLTSLNFSVENISALVGNNGVNIGAGGYNNLVVLPTEVLIQNVPLNLPGGSLKHDDALGFLTVEGPVTADMIDAGSPGTYATISNGVEILTHRPGDDLARKFRFAWDGALYMPTDSSNGQVGAIEWRINNDATTSQIRSTPGGGIFPPGLALVSYGENPGISFNVNFNKNWIFDKYGNTRIPGDIVSEGNINIDINLTDSTLHRWTFGEDGDLNIPGAVRQGNSKLAFNENGGTNVYLTPTTDDSSAVFINTTSVQAYATEAVSIQAGNAAGLGDLELIWANAEVVWIDARDNDAASISPATRPWAGMSSYDAYPVIIAYTAPGGVLPTPSNFPPVANSARQAHIAWQEGLATVEGVSITAGAYGWQFKPTGVLELPGAVQLKVYQNTLERDLYIETPVAGMMVLVGTATQVYDGSAWRTLSYAP